MYSYAYNTYMHIQLLWAQLIQYVCKLSIIGASYPIPMGASDPPTVYNMYMYTPMDMDVYAYAYI